MPTITAPTPASTAQPAERLPQPLGWPAAPLTPLQLRRRAAQEAAMRAGRVARWPQGMVKP